MAKLLRTSLLQSLDFKIVNKKRFRLFINIAIFLSIFAVSSSIITINYENKINKIKSEILQYQGDLYYAKATQTIIPFKIMETSLILDDISKTEMIMNLNYYSDLSVLTQRDVYYFPYIRLESYVIDHFSHVEEFFELTNLIIKEGITDQDLNLREKANKYVHLFSQKKDLEKKMKEFEIISNDVNNDHKNIDDFSDKPLDYYDKYANYLFTAKENMKLLNNFFSDSVEIVNVEMSRYEKEILTLSKEISFLSNKSSNTILVAFFIQLLIFILIQIMEISTTREQNEKR